MNDNSLMLHAIAEQYRAYFRLPDSKAIAVATFISRMPYGMLAFAMLMFLRETSNSFATAGTAVGAYFIAMSVTSPVMGRVIDRIGPRWPMLVTSIVQPLSLALLYVAAVRGWPLAWLLAITAVAGGFAVPIAVLTRTLTRHRFDDEQSRKIAFAVDSVLIELNFTLGPGVVAVLLAVASARAAYLTSIGVLVIGILTFMRSPSLKYWKHEPLAERHLLGPLTQPRLVLLLICTIGLTYGFGVVEVAYPAYGTAGGVAALGGVLLALCSLGSAVGGMGYGGLHFAWPVERQFLFALAIVCITLLLHTVTDVRWVYVVLSFLTGFAIAPAITMQSLLVSRYAPAQYATEAFTWLSTCIVVGLGIGTAATGWIVEHWGVRGAFLVGAAITGAAALLALFMPSTQADTELATAK